MTFIFGPTVSFTLVLCAPRASMCLCPNPTWQLLPLFVPQYGGQIDIYSVRGQTDTQTDRQHLPFPNTHATLSCFVSQQFTSRSLHPHRKRIQSIHPSLLLHNLILSQLEAAGWSWKRLTSIFHVDPSVSSLLSWALGGIVLLDFHACTEHVSCVKSECITSAYPDDIDICCCNIIRGFKRVYSSNPLEKDVFYI